LEGKEPKPLSCPFCGAPQRKPIPSNAAQVKCQYCGGIIQVSQAIGGRVYRCLNHPEKMASGKCNDCGENFCEDCLSIYTLNTDTTEATLYLCPTCLRKRYAKKASQVVFLGAMLVLLGLFSALVVSPIGIVVALLGVGALIYGFLQKGNSPEAVTLHDLREQEEERTAELSASGWIDVEEQYNKLLTYYVSHWGAMTGTEFLDNEIGAYTRRGISFEEAVKKVYQRQEEKLQNI
jgi:hypothetical protein